MMVNLDDAKTRKRKLKWTLDFEDDTANAVLTLAANGRLEWTLSEWETLLKTIKTSELTIGQWLDQRRGK